MTRKPVAKKTGSPAKTAAKTASSTAPITAAKPKPSTHDTMANADVEAAVKLRKSDFVERVATRSALKKNQVRPVIEAALAVLGDALEAGETLQLPPLGRLKVRKMTGKRQGANPSSARYAP